jgi:hypothetical protein
MLIPGERRYLKHACKRAIAAHGPMKATNSKYQPVNFRHLHRIWSQGAEK